MQIDSLCNRFHPPDSCHLGIQNQLEPLERIAKAIERVPIDEKLFDLVNYDTVFTVLVTICIFILGIIIERVLKYIDRQNDRKKLRKYFKTYLDKITDETCTILSDEYRKFYQDINIDTGIPTTPPKLLTGDFERIKNIVDKELFSAIKEKSSLSKILSSLDFLEKLIHEIDRYHAHVREGSDNLRLTLENIINEYFDQLSNYLEHIRVSQPQYNNRDRFRDLVNNSILKYHQKIAGTRGLTKLYREIIRPIQEEVVRTNIFRLDSEALKIAEIGKKLSYQYNHLRLLVIEIRLEYRKFHRYVNSTYSKLSSERDRITWR